MPTVKVGMVLPKVLLMIKRKPRELLTQTKVQWMDIKKLWMRNQKQSQLHQPLCRVQKLNQHFSKLRKKHKGPLKTLQILIMKLKYQSKKELKVIWKPPMRKSQMLMVFLKRRHKNKQLLKKIIMKPLKLLSVPVKLLLIQSLISQN